MVDDLGPVRPQSSTGRSTATRRERRWLRGRGTRWLLAAAAVFIVVASVPGYVGSDVPGADAHAARHLAAWQIGFGVGLLVAARVSRLSQAMLALAATFAVLTIGASVIDIVTGHHGPILEVVHLVELIAVVLLWRLTPPHLLPWRRASRAEGDRPDGHRELRAVPFEEGGRR